MSMKSIALASAMTAVALAALVGIEAPAAAQEASPSVDVGSGAPPATYATEHRRYRVPRAARRTVDRPLTVRREAPPPFIQPGPGRAFAGPAAIVTAPIVAASEAVGIPFRMLNTIFPAYGNPAQNPFVLIGAPIQAAGEIAQVPFTVVEAPFRTAPPATF